MMSVALLRPYSFLGDPPPDLSYSVNLGRPTLGTYGGLSPIDCGSGGGPENLACMGYNAVFLRPSTPYRILLHK